MRKNLLMLLLLCSVLVNAQTVTYYYEDFQLGTDPTDMTYYDLDKLEINSTLDGTGLGCWHILKMNSGDTNLFIGSTSWFKTPGQANDWMITPQIKIYGKGAKLSWKGIVCDKSAKRDGYKVYISKGGKEVADFDPVPVFSIDAESSSDWVTHEINLDAYADELIYIAFVNDSYDKYVLGIDDITVTGPQSEVSYEFTNKSMTSSGGINVSVDITSNIDVTIDNCTLSVTADGETFSQEFTNLALTKGGKKSLVMDEQIKVALGESKEFTAWIVVNNVKYLPVTMSVEGTYFVPNQRVVIEESTGSWCGYCPMGMVAFEYLEKWYPDNFIGIAIHNGNDVLAYESYFNYLGFSGSPMGVINRRVTTSPVVGNAPSYSLLGSGFEGVLLSELKTLPVGEINGTAIYSKDNSNIIIDVNVATKFVKNLPNDPYVISLVLTEDDVTKADGKLYAQRSYYYSSIYKGINIEAKNEALADMGGIALKEEYFSTSYDHVARVVVQDAFEGLDPQFPDNLQGGEEYNNALKLTMEPGVVNNLDKTSLVALLIDGDGEIVNACKMPLTTAGVANIDAAQLKVVVNNGQLIVSDCAAETVSVELVNINGQVIFSDSKYVDGTGNFDLNAIAHGAYIVKVNSSKETVVKKIIL